MSEHFTTFQGSVHDAIRTAIEQALPGSQAEVTGSGGHFSVVVRSAMFEGKSMLESHRLVYSAISHLMAGNAPPVHAVDSLKTLTPA